MADEQNPKEQRGGTTPDEAEAREKGDWAGSGAGEGIVPPEGVEPDTKDIGAPTRQPNTDNAA